MSKDKLAALWRSDGRIGRIEYWIANIGVMLVAAFVMPHQHAEPAWIFWLIIIPLAVFQIHIDIKRAHDRNRSFLFVLLFFVPIVCLWPIIELGFFPRVDKDNAYGTRPLF